MKNFLIFIFVVASNFLFAQEKTIETPFAVADSLYREDQFYLGTTYNLLLNMPADLKQDGLSLGFTAGFLRDFPINKARTMAIAVGLGATFNKFHQNLFVSSQNNDLSYDIVSDQAFDRNKMEQLMIDIPIEFRWRTSTPDSHKFFRLYTGFKVGYVVLNKTKFVGASEAQTIINSPDFSKLQYGPTISVGYNTWNIYAYYGLNSIFNNVVVDGQSLNMTNFSAGLIFYIL